MPKNYTAKNKHIQLDSEMFEFLARIDTTLREKALKDAIRDGTEILHNKYIKRVPRSRGKKTSGYLQEKSRVKVSQADRWGRKWMGRIVAPHIHLFEAGFNHTGHKPDKSPTSRGRVKGKELIPKLKKQHRNNIAAAMWRHLKKAAKKAGNLRRKTRPR